MPFEKIQDANESQYLPLHPIELHLLQRIAARLPQSTRADRSPAYKPRLDYLIRFAFSSPRLDRIRPFILSQAQHCIETAPDDTVTVDTIVDVTIAAIICAHEDCITRQRVQLLNHACSKFANPDTALEYVQLELDAERIAEPQFVLELHKAILSYVFEP